MYFCVDEAARHQAQTAIVAYFPDLFGGAAALMPSIDL